MYDFALWFRQSREHLLPPQRGIAALKPTARMSLLVTITAVSLGVGAERVHASPSCQQLIRVYTEKLVPHKISQATAARWARWNKLHPDFHPAPRPRYTMTKEETSKRLDFACQVELASVPVDGFLIPGEPMTIEPYLRTLETDTGAPTIPSVPGTYLMAEGPAAPVFPSVFPPIGRGDQPPFILTGAPVGIAVGVAPVPEPSGLILLGTGLLFLLVVKQRGAYGSATP